MVDNNELTIPFDSSQVTITVKGEGELIAAGSGNVKVQGSLQNSVLNLYQGKGLAIIRSTGNQGKIEVSAQSKDGIESNMAVVQAK